MEQHIEPCVAILGEWIMLIITSHKPHAQVTFIRLKQTIFDKFKQFGEFVVFPRTQYKRKMRKRLKIKPNVPLDSVVLFA